jgi:hypothetical protein
VATLVVMQPLSKHIDLWSRLHEVCDYDFKSHKKRNDMFLVLLLRSWASFTIDNISFTTDFVTHYTILNLILFLHLLNNIFVIFVSI